MSKPVTHVALIVDRSSSMHGIRQEAIDAFNDQLKTIQDAEALGTENYVTLVTFATTVDAPHYNDVAAKKVPQLTPENYVPRGGTALLDAMAETVNRFKEFPDAKEEKTSFLVVVITDGEENSSQEYGIRNDGPAKMATLIKELEETNRWTFVYLCANVDPTKIQQSLGLSANNVRGFAASSQGIKTISADTSDSMTQYFTGRSRGMTSTPDFYTPNTDPNDFINPVKQFSVNTYIIHLENNPGYEWVPDSGETIIAVAATLKDAFQQVTLIDSLECQIYDDLTKNKSAKLSVDGLLPLQIDVTEIPAVGVTISGKFIKKTLQDKINDYSACCLKDIDDQDAAKKAKDAAIEKLKEEAKKLGLSLEDLTSNQGW